MVNWSLDDNTWILLSRTIMKLLRRGGGGGQGNGIWDLGVMNWNLGWIWGGNYLGFGQNIWDSGFEVHTYFCCPAWEYFVQHRVGLVYNKHYLFTWLVYTNLNHWCIYIYHYYAASGTCNNLPNPWSQMIYQWHGEMMYLRKPWVMEIAFIMLWVTAW